MQEIITVAVSTVLTAFLGWFALWLKKKSVESAAVDVIKNAVALVQEEYVTEIKRASADGLLTKEEAAIARQLAWDKAIGLAKGPVKDVLLKWGFDVVQALITRVVQSKKVS